MSKDSISKIKMGCVIAGISFFLLIVGSIWLLLSAESVFLLLNREDYFSVSDAFLLALMENRVDIAKSLVSVEQWPQVDAWVTNHEVTDCSTQRLMPGFDRPLFEGVGGALNNETENSVSLTLRLPCPSESDAYCLTVKDINLRKTEDGWQIQSWGEIIEYRSEFGCPG